MKQEGNGTPVCEDRGKLAVIDPENVRTIIVAGDIHGDLQAFKRINSLLGPEDLAIFLGDYADRGPSGLEVLEGLIELSQKKTGGRIIPLKGNHEDFTTGGDPRFHPCTLVSEAERKGRRWKTLFPELQAFFDSLFLGVLIPGFALFVHGGISKEIVSPDTIDHPTATVAEDILWSDPGPRPGQHPNSRGAGKLFGPDVTATVLDSLGVHFLIRSHEPRKAPDAPCFEHGGSVITTNTTTVYGGKPFILRLPAHDLPRTQAGLAGCVVSLT